MHLIPRHIRDPCTGDRLSAFYSIELRDKPVHRDPRLDLGFYTGYYMPGGRLPKKQGKALGEGDVLLFMAGLARYPENVWSRPKTTAEIKRIFRRVLRNPSVAGIYIVGGIVIDKVMDISEYGWDKALKQFPLLRESPHYYRPGDRPVAVIGRGFLLDPPMRISSKTVRGAPSEELVSLVGWENAWMIARNHYRRSRVMEISGKTLSKTLVQL